MIFLDSSFWYNLFRPSEKLHSKSLELLNLCDEYNSVKVINSVVLSETLNKSKKYKLTPSEIFDIFKDHVNIVYLSKEDYLEALYLNKQYNDSVNYSDCVILKTMMDLKITDIISFDSDFDKINGINRIC